MAMSGIKRRGCVHTCPSAARAGTWLPPSTTILWFSNCYPATTPTQPSHFSSVGPHPLACPSFPTPTHTLCTRMYRLSLEPHLHVIYNEAAALPNPASTAARFLLPPCTTPKTRKKDKSTRLTLPCLAFPAFLPGYSLNFHPSPRISKCARLGMMTKNSETPARIVARCFFKRLNFLRIRCPRVTSRGHAFW